MPRLSLDNIAVDVTGAARPLRVLDHVSLALEDGAVAAIVGPSGAGKTTLLHVIAGLVRPTQGAVAWEGQTVSALAEGRRDRWRRDTVGMVFQNFYLIDELSALDNILLPLTFDRLALPPKARAEARALGTAMGLANLPVRAQALSRGEQQRVAIARALIRRPRLLLADEPTASLDRTNADAVADLLLGAARDSGATLLVASHDQALLSRIPIHFQLAAGRLSGDAP